MMFDVTEHIECDSVLDPVAQGPGDVVGTITVMVHRPYREECSQALPDCHGNHVVPKRAAMPDAENQG